MQVVAVHGGAGFHSPSSAPEVKRALRLACAGAIAVRGDGTSALQSVSAAIVILEEEECLNAGYGSNLTLSGTVECDASIMDGRTGDFGAVGAVPDVQNPILLAHQVLRYSRKPDPLTRIPPLLLVSIGASEFAQMQRLQRRPAAAMISPRARQEWMRWKSQLDSAQAPSLSGALDPESLDTSQSVPAQLDGLRNRQDTVGAVAWDAAGDLAAGVSSGGLLLKLPGRVGEAAIYGTGCWATRSVACSVSGAGEYITRMSLARTICEAVEAAGDEEDIHEILRRVLETEFLKLCSERGETSPQAGIILLVKEQDAAGQPKPRLWCAFTTESMAVGFTTSQSQKASATILRRPPRAPGNNSQPSAYITALPLSP
ncbi:N-terminal nucleophile aminohydrolase [Lentinus tigrinus ALCF2SS1-7]|uniref:N-terminal nucleophile aminohydrolase n=1 Tax=Lentinus tigrinus ALCF2SS1-7 TaxID=1328758 RepID=UPI0011661875|nr:N-terminal nucleophile aminohydrolase [Lentinus tigrinus ALCF2SS1-7]